MKKIVLIITAHPPMNLLIVRKQPPWEAPAFLFCYPFMTDFGNEGEVLHILRRITPTQRKAAVRVFSL